MTRAAILPVLVALLVAPAAAQSLGVSPSSLDEGTQEPGGRFYTEFWVLGDEEDTAFTLSVAPGSLRAFGNLKPGKRDNFSAQPCTDCVTFIRGAGELSQDAVDGDRTGRLVKFLVDVPEDIEPGYHMIRVRPVPSVSGAGTVALASTSAVPVIFRVAGRAIRSGKIIGVRAGDNVAGEQRIVGTFYNDGTVTVETEFAFTANTTGGVERLPAGSATVAPGETATFRAAVDTDAVNETFGVTGRADYGTGRATLDRSVAVAAPEQPSTPQRQRPDGTSLPVVLLAVALLAVTTVLTWRVVRDA